MTTLSQTFNYNGSTTPHIFTPIIYQYVTGGSVDVYSISTYSFVVTGGCGGGAGPLINGGLGAVVTATYENIVTYENIANGIYILVGGSGGMGGDSSGGGGLTQVFSVDKNNIPQVNIIAGGGGGYGEGKNIGGNGGFNVNGDGGGGEGGGNNSGEGGQGNVGGRGDGNGGGGAPYKNDNGTVDTAGGDGKTGQIEGGGGGGGYGGGQGGGTTSGGGYGGGAGSSAVLCNPVEGSVSYASATEAYAAANGGNGSVIISWTTIPIPNLTLSNILNIWWTAANVAGINPPADVVNPPSYIYNTFGPISKWDTSAVTRMDNAFATDNRINVDISGWDTSNVISMSNMFERNTAFNNGGQPLTWTATDNLVITSSMFARATTFNQPLSSFNMLSITDMSSMFAGATAFNQDVSAWTFTNPTSAGQRIALTDMFTGSAVPATPVVNDKIYNAWLKYFTSAELLDAGLVLPTPPPTPTPTPTPTPPTEVVPHKPQPVGISYSFADGKLTMVDASGAAINTPIKLSLNIDLNITF